MKKISKKNVKGKRSSKAQNRKKYGKPTYANPQKSKSDSKKNLKELIEKRKEAKAKKKAKDKKSYKSEGVITTTINWYPGHMFKTKNEIAQALSQLDIVIEVLDARIPVSSRNHDLLKMVKKKKSIKEIIVLNKTDLADPEETKKWIEMLSGDEKVITVMEMDASKGKGIAYLKNILKKENEKLDRVTSITASIFGIPNVGKSTIINKIKGKNSLEASNKPGVTKALRKIKVDDKIVMLDTPGMLWPKFEDEQVGINLAITGAIKDTVFDTLNVVFDFLKSAMKNKNEILKIIERYNVSEEELKEISEKPNSPYKLMLKMAEKKNIVIRGGEYDLEKLAVLILNDFRDGKFGRITIEKVEV